MKEGILGPKVENVGIAIVQEVLESGDKGYAVYLLNYRDDIIEGIIITSKGYGAHPTSGEQVKTSSLRHGVELLLPNEGARLEPIMEEMFGLTNEFHVSFWINELMYDKKYIFLPDTVSEENMIEIPYLDKKGVLIK